MTRNPTFSALRAKQHAEIDDDFARRTQWTQHAPQSVRDKVEAFRQDAHRKVDEVVDRMETARSNANRALLWLIILLVGFYAALVVTTHIWLR